ncbi:glycosyltransferase family 4 protein [Paenibacillus beijingensis]|uniref:Glycosyl transferase n=1 Tax=Paenibacillus beijingensis TaxID=1126833 RepID=A0A0D5NK38_9BACL|nr:glycosyltransferase family 4 protein [Paenibacillus beijingensis]AJY75709.1 glycosyl transferase [Paenibacillus beijingensis]
MARILHVSEFTKGGIETHLNEILTYQAAFHDVYLMVSEQNSNKDALHISPDRLFLYPYRRHPKYFAGAMKSIWNTVKEINPDIIHIHGTFAGFFLRTLLFFKKERPAVIYCAHGWSFLMDTASWKKKLFGWIEKVLSAKTTDAIINISNYEYQYALKYGIPPKKSVIVYNGVSEAEKASELPFTAKKDQINLLYIGRFDRQKGFDLLLDVFNRHKFANVNLYLVGDTVLKDQHHYELPDNAIKIGWVKNSEVDKYVRACDAVIVPSRWEGFGIVAIEALRNRKPVIASNRGALPEIVQHGVNGYIFDFDKREELAAIIKQLDKPTLEKMGNTGEQIFRKKFHSSKMNEQIEQLYESIVQRPNPQVAFQVKKYV